ncbi:MAG: MobA-like NTP transferase domain containing protein [Deltaproteobacteria bacterium]|nr:MAG: MobA-like NTP transferase domain containing protein [Desulfobacteraceae bacterium 4484_190.3]RLB19052.1 MAG: MobA-like NTP transferase domain containing protein [Deltaproteobacteria bacterium]
MEKNDIASIILAAGRGSRMKGFEGNKTLLPLVPEGSPYQGRVPILSHILRSLPPGQKAVVVHHDQEAVRRETAGLNITYAYQPVLNGTGGALLAALDFLRQITHENVILTMGDVPLVLPETYVRMADQLKEDSMVVLGFEPADRKQYGVLETRGRQVSRIIEWKYWKDLATEIRDSLRVCNSGIYAAKREILLHYLDRLASSPHLVQKEIDGRWNEVAEFFITDLVEYMYKDGVPAGYMLAEDEYEVMGVDDLSALETAQRIYRERFL